MVVRAFHVSFLYHSDTSERFSRFDRNVPGFAVLCSFNKTFQYLRWCPPCVAVNSFSRYLDLTIHTRMDIEQSQSSNVIRMSWSGLHSVRPLRLGWAWKLPLDFEAWRALYLPWNSDPPFSRLHLRTIYRTFRIAIRPNHLLLCWSRRTDGMPLLHAPYRRIPYWINSDSAEIRVWIEMELIAAM